ncbi:MAG: DNA replication and repair protein RecF [Paludibacteraceae bacterium]|nr:DNA replication and repair protein RecF [Paludibacteraceae bacterium]
MYLRELNILNFRNIESASLSFSPKINCLVGQNGMGKTNVLDAVYYLSFCKSSLCSIDSQNIRHDSEMAMVQGEYVFLDEENAETVSCGLRRGQKKQFRRGKKDYKRLIEHIGLIPLVMVSPKDSELVLDGSDERRRFMDSVISQQNRKYLEFLTDYNALLKQRNTLLKQMQDEAVGGAATDETMLEVYEQKMTPLAEYIYAEREAFINAFVPVFQDIYNFIAEQQETVDLHYRSQLADRSLDEAYSRTRQRDLILGWTSQGIHKDELEMSLGGYPLKQVASQGQQKTYLISLKLAQAVWLSKQHSLVQNTVKPLLLLDDIFDKLDSHRVRRIVELVGSERFGQIFITDTDRQHLTELMAADRNNNKVFTVENGTINPLTD